MIRPGTVILDRHAEYLTNDDILKQSRRRWCQLTLLVENQEFESFWIWKQAILIAKWNQFMVEIVLKYRLQNFDADNFLLAAT